MTTRGTDVGQLATESDAQRVSGARAVGLVATLLLGVIAYQLNASMIAPALPDIARQLRVGTDQVAQVSSLFFLAGAIGGVVLSRWSDFVGRRRALVGVLLVTTAGTLLCVLASTLPLLLVGRVLQGASSAAFQLAYVILNERLSAKIFGTALGAITAINGGVGGVDGFVGGLLSDRFGFRAVFAVILLVGVLAVVCVAAVVPKAAPPVGGGRMDWWGSAALSGGLICLTFFVSRGSSADRVGVATLCLLLGALVCFAGFWLIEKRTAVPLIAVEHLRSRQLWPVILTTVLVLSGIFAVINFTVVLLSQDATVGFGLSAATSALLFLTPAALIGVFAAPLSGWIAGRRGWIRTLRVGLVISIAALLVLALLPLHQWVVVTIVALLGVSYNGLVLTTLNGLGVLLSPREAPAALPGLNGAAFGIGASLGIGLVAPFAARGSASGYSVALWISLGITALALATSLFIQPRAGEAI
jgi:predicted MFS family arabinose efflux permease